MSDPRSRRARILIELINQLKTISVANGYANNVCDVTTVVKSWRTTPEAETPVLYVIDQNTQYLYGPTKTLQHEWTIGIFGVMKNKTQMEMEELIADIEECLFKNVTLNHTISHLRILDITTDGQFFSEIEGSQLFEVKINFLYLGCVDNPR